MPDGVAAPPPAASAGPGEAALVLDRRAEMGAAPGLHAILIGVSDYTYLSAADDVAGEGLLALQKLDFAARSAAALAGKLRALDDDGRLLRRLKTVRLLAAPSPAEKDAEPALADPALIAPTRRNIRGALQAWRADVAQGQDEVALFYFAGHGIRRSLEESILLAADFLEDPETQLDNAFRLRNVYEGMAVSDERPGIGRTQFFFVDACRDKPPALDALDDTTTPKIWDTDLNGVDGRCSPIYFSTPAGGVAGGASGGTTFFMTALLWALDHGAYRRERLPGLAGAVWPIRPKSLHDGLKCVDAGSSRYELTGNIGDGILCFGKDPPRLTLRVQFDPDGAGQPPCMLELLPLAGDAIAVATAGSPCAVPEVSAGLYRLSLRAPADPSLPRTIDYCSDIEQVNVGLTMPWLHVVS